MPRRPAWLLSLLLALVVIGCQVPTSSPPPASTLPWRDRVVTAEIPTVEDATVASGERPARALGEVGEYADGVAMVMKGLDRGYQLADRPGVPRHRRHRPGGQRF